VLVRLAALVAVVGFSFPAAAQTTPVAPRVPPAGAPLGVNLAEWANYHPEWVFVDVFKGASDWVSQRTAIGGAWNTGEWINFGANGYPASLSNNQAAACVMCKALAGRYPGGRYVCLWDGDGDLQLTQDAVQVSRSGNRIEADVTPEDGIVLRIVRTNPSNPVRNVRVIMPGFEATYQTRPFHPRFLANWRGFKVLRFMNWMRTGNLQAQWSERPTPDYYSQGTPRGVAVEYMVDLANELDADPWFCFPHLATDDYVRQFARAVSARLEPGRRVYLEYSNECWNGAFVQATYCRSEGQRLQLSNDPFEAQLRFYSQRAVELFRIAHQELSWSHSITRVLASQNVSAWVSATMLDWRNAWREVDGLAVAPYFGYDLGDPNRQWEVSQWNVDRVLTECWRSLTPTLRGTMDNAAVCRQRGLELLAYEGGQHLVGFGGAENNTALTNLFIAANRHPTMYALYTTLLEGWSAAGGKTFVAYNSTGKPSKWGSWGALEWIDQDPYTAPKYLALQVWRIRRSFGL
jgi:hypothetical protein